MRFFFLDSKCDLQEYRPQNKNLRFWQFYLHYKTSSEHCGKLFFHEGLQEKIEKSTSRWFVVIKKHILQRILIFELQSMYSMSAVKDNLGVYHTFAPTHFFHYISSLTKFNKIWILMSDFIVAETFKLWNGHSVKSRFFIFYTMEKHTRITG